MRTDIICGRDKRIIAPERRTTIPARDRSALFDGWGVRF